MEQLNNSEKQATLYKLLIAVASLTLVIGISYPFFDLNILNEKYEDVGFVAALFSLSGILFFCAALVYQVKEFKLQVRELEKSVEAQNKSSKALEEQKNLLVEQTTNTNIFNVIESFNIYKEKESIQSALDIFYKRYSSQFNNIYIELLEKNLKKDEFNEALASGICNTFNTQIKDDLEYHVLRRFVQFVYNIFYLIDKDKEVVNDWFKPFVFNHLSREEFIIVYLFNLIPFSAPLYLGLDWTNPVSEELIDMITMSPKRNRSDLISADLLTVHFMKLKQR